MPPRPPVAALTSNLSPHRPPPSLSDAFKDADTAAEKDAGAATADSYVHIRVQQRNGRKSLTTIQVRERAERGGEQRGRGARGRGRGRQRQAATQPSSFFSLSPAPSSLSRLPSSPKGLEKGYDYKKVLKAFKKEFCCNGTVVEDAEVGHVIQLQGDQRKNASTFLVENKLVKKGALKIHGF